MKAEEAHRTNVLFVGDIVGPEAARWLAERLPELRYEHGAHLVVANAENCAITGPSPMNGFGMTSELVELLLSSSVDVITGGNHSWDGLDTEEVLAHPRVLRPYNVPEDTSGKGILETETASGPITIVNLISETAKLPGKLSPDPSPPYEAWRSLRDEGPRTILVDFHGDSPWEKMSFATAVDGEAAAVLGTHTHDPTARCHLLPGGTAFVTEVGMTGRLGWTGGGFVPGHFAAALRGDDLSFLPPYELTTGPMTLGAVLLGLKGSKAVAVERVY